MAGAFIDVPVGWSVQTDKLTALVLEKDGRFRKPDWSGFRSLVRRHGFAISLSIKCVPLFFLRDDIVVPTASSLWGVSKATHAFMMQKKHTIVFGTNKENFPLKDVYTNDAQTVVLVLFAKDSSFELKVGESLVLCESDKCTVVVVARGVEIELFRCVDKAPGGFLVAMNYCMVHVPTRYMEYKLLTNKSFISFGSEMSHLSAAYEELGDYSNLLPVDHAIVQMMKVFANSSRMGLYFCKIKGNMAYLTECVTAARYRKETKVRILPHCNKRKAGLLLTD